jgi:hypothetical protein
MLRSTGLQQLKPCCSRVLLLGVLLAWGVALGAEHAPHDFHERVLLWGDAQTKWSSSTGEVSVSAFKGAIVHLDTLLKVPSFHLPRGVQSIRLISSPSNTFSVDSPLFPSHCPSTQLYVKYQHNFTKHSINHTELSNLIESLFLPFENIDTSKMATVNSELIPLTYQYLIIDPFTHRPKSQLAGYLKTAALYPTTYSAESAFSSGKSNTKSFLSRFFSWYLPEFIQPSDEWGSSFIDMEIALA